MRKSNFFLELRNDIDTLRMERDQFDSMYQKIVDALTKMKSEINKLTDLTTQAYCIRYMIMKNC